MTLSRRGPLIRRALVGALLLTPVFLAPVSGWALARPANSSSTLHIWYGSDDPTEQTWANGLAQQFAAAHPEIKVQFSFYDLDDLDFIDWSISQSTATTLLAHGLIPARKIDPGSVKMAAPFQHDFLTALASAKKGVYLDAVPVPDFLATMEAQLQQLLAGKETPAALTKTLQSAYASHGRTAQFADTDGEF
jgi:ABC-type glycerol-3-phosphate transport system substrate-binding protein